jgi:hypothetical protein
MTSWYVIAAALLVGVLVLVIVTIASRKTATLNKDYFQHKWGELLKLMESETGRRLAVIEADKLLDEALKRRHVSGKTMGERLVSAQKLLSNNDSVWHAHKLRNRLVHEAEVRLRQGDVEQAMRGFRQALRDVGAL